MPKTAYGDLVAEALQKRLKQDSEDIVSSFGPELTVGATAMNHQERIDLISRNWPNPQFRQSWLKAVGPDAFVQDWKDGVANGSITVDPAIARTTLVTTDSQGNKLNLGSPPPVAGIEELNASQGSPNVSPNGPPGNVPAAPAGP